VKQIRTLALRGLFCALLAAAVAVSSMAQADGGFGPPPGGPPPEGSGQEGGSRGPSVERDLKLLTKQLALTTEQQAQVKTILTERNQKTGELMRSMRPSQQSGSDSAQQGPPSSEQLEQMRTQMKAIRDDANTKIAAALTAEQATKFSALLKKRQRNGDDDSMPPGPPPDGDMGGPGGPPAF